MMRLVLISLVIGTACAGITIDSVHRKSSSTRYKPEWGDLDTRPLPQWYDKAKIGIFVHWGVYAVPGFSSEWIWTHWKNYKKPEIINFMQKNYKPGFSYQEFAPMFTAEFFSPEDWAILFRKAGARYIVLTSKHHDGFALYPSKRSFSWNSVDVGPKRDLVGDLASAVRNQGLKFGVYHSLMEWFNPMYLDDKKAKFSTKTFVNTKLVPDIKQLVNDYRPSVLWSDGDWDAYDTYWNSTNILAWLYNDSPVKDEIVVNDRWGIDTYGKHGGFYNHADRYNPGKLLKHKWENAFTVDSQSWGYRRNMKISDVLSIKLILKEVVSTVSCGGNALINVGPTKEGTIPLIFQERLLALGQWLEINGEAIYESSPWLHQKDTINGNVWYTCTKALYNAAAKLEESEELIAVYAIFLSWPANNLLRMKDITPELQSGTYTIKLLGNSYLDSTINDDVTEIHLPDKAEVKSENAWTLKFTIL